MHAWIEGALCEQQILLQVREYTAGLTDKPTHLADITTPFALESERDPSDPEARSLGNIFNTQTDRPSLLFDGF